MWMRKTEKMDPTLHTYNRYGVQLGTKVPLRGGFTEDGTFSWRLGSAKPKMKKEEWVQCIPQLKRAAAVSESSELLIVCKHYYECHNHVFDNPTCASNNKVVESRSSRCGMTMRSSSRHQRNTRKLG